MATNPTNPPVGPARDPGIQCVTYIRFDINYSDAGIGNAIAVGRILPAGGIIVGTDVMVNATFNAGTANTLTIGTNGTTANNIVATVTATSGALTQNLAPTGTALGKLAADSPIYKKYTSTGTAATQGNATFIVKFVPNNDL